MGREPSCEGKEKCETSETMEVGGPHSEWELRLGAQTGSSDWGSSDWGSSDWELRMGELRMGELRLGAPVTNARGVCSGVRRGAQRKRPPDLPT
jgi:hypothetical protein